MNINFISFGTGGAEIFNAIVPGFIENNKKDEIKNITISDYAKNKNKESLFIPAENIIDYLKENKPDIVINERSNGLDIQNDISKHCKDNNILNICILDTYGDYDKRFVVMPDKILVPSESIYKELLKLGYKDSDLIVSGNPSFDRLEEYKNVKVTDRLSPNILFTSQLFDKFYVFEEFFKEISKLYSDFTISVKLHPQEDIKNWESVIGYFKNTSILNFDDKGDFLKECLNYDLIIGYNSTLQIQSQIIGIPTIFYELGEIEKMLTCFKNRDNLKTHPHSDFLPNATESTLDELQNIIRQKA